MIKRQIEKLIRAVTEDKYGHLDSLDCSVERPKEKQNGDYASNVAMVLAKRLGKNPVELGKELAAALAEREEGRQLFSRVETAGPGFINFYLKDEVLFANAERVLKLGDKFGKSSLGSGQTVVIDYSSLNIAKPMHVGHLRSTIIGQALYNIYRSLGYTVIGDNHLGDWGTQFGKMIYAYKNWSDKKTVSRDPIEEMSRLYVRFHQEASARPELEELARQETKKLQEGDDENTKIWQFMVRASLKDANRIYKALDVRIDNALGESFYRDMLPKVIEDAKRRGIAKESEGALIIDLGGYNLPPFLIQKNDGASLYATTDIATAKWRKEKWKADKVLYVVSNEQALHFEQLFSALALLGYCPETEFEHVKFGMVLGEAGKKFSTRKGDAVRLEEVLSRSQELAYKVIEEKNPELSRKEKKKIASIVGIGAVKYNDLSQNRLTDIAFNWEKMLSFEGNSAPYLQYTYARISSVLGRHRRENRLESLLPGRGPKFELLSEESEKDILRQLQKYPEAVENAAKENGPHLLALYTYQLAGAYNTFYNTYPILKTDKELSRARLALSEAVAVVLKNSLGLLGIEVLEKM